MTNQVCFTTMEFDEPWTLENYLKVGGYQAWKKILEQKTDPVEIIDEVKREFFETVSAMSERYL